MKTLVNRKELAAILGLKYEQVSWRVRQMPNEGKRDGCLVYDLDSTIKRLAVQPTRKNPDDITSWRPRATQKPQRQRQPVSDVPTFDDLPFIEQRRIRAERERIAGSETKKGRKMRYE